MPATIRPLAAADHDRWRELWTGYLDFYETAAAEEVYARTWQRLMTEGESPHGFCAVDVDDRPYGLVHYIFHRSCWTLGDYCYLQDLYVEEAARGTGAGRALIEAVYGAADDHGASTVYWLTQDFNETARLLYDRVAKVTPFIKYTR